MNNQEQIKLLTDRDIFPLISTQEMIENNEGIKILIENKEGYITGYDNNKGFIISLIDSGDIKDNVNSENIKPIFRTIDQITDEERIEYKQLKNIKSNNKYNIPYYNGLKSIWYIRKGFDLFQWIDQKLAIKYESNISIK